MRSSRLKLLAVALLLTAGILRFSALGRQGIWDDESFTLRDPGDTGRAEPSAGLP